MTVLDPDRARTAIVEHTRRLADAVATIDPTAPVPTAPEWTAADLVAHLGQTQHWVAEIIERRIADPTQLPTTVVAAPTDPGEWTAWLDKAAHRVADACSADALAASVFNAAGDERTGGQFWLISMVNEAVVHGVDGAVAAGRRAEVEPDIAGALISNHLAMLTSPTWELQRPESAHALRGTGQTLQWLATDSADGDQGWFVERRPDGVTVRVGGRDADVTVSGSAASLLLLLTRRLPLAAARADVTVEGDSELVRHWIESTAHVSG